MANFDIYAAITDRIIAELENGIIPWRKPWTGTTNGAISRETGRPYSLLNQMMLGKPGEYLTWNQVKKEGGSVKKGAKARMVVFWKVYPREKKNADGQTVTDSEGKPVMEGLPVLRYFNVFHIDDCDGIKPKYTSETTKHADPVQNAEETFSDYVSRSGVRFENVRQDQAYYNPSIDLIRLPLMEQFPSTAEYYSTLFHEATHSTGHPKRLDRLPKDAVAAHFGSDEYSKEELVAEIGAASILNVLGLETTNSFKNSAAYIQSWLRALKNDKRMIVSAASRAEKAVKLILNTAE